MLMKSPCMLSGDEQMKCGLQRAGLKVTVYEPFNFFSKLQAQITLWRCSGMFSHNIFSSELKILQVNE